MKTRLATTEDIVELSVLWCIMCKEEHPDAAPNIEWWKIREHILLGSGVYYSFVVTKDKAIIGFLSYYINKEPLNAEISVVGQHFYILPAYRNTGASVLLWRAARKWAQKLKALSIEITCVVSKTEFWEKHGFSISSVSLKKKGV